MFNGLVKKVSLFLLGLMLSIAVYANTPELVSDKILGTWIQKINANDYLVLNFKNQIENKSENAQNASTSIGLLTITKIFKNSVNKTVGTYTIADNLLTLTFGIMPIEYYAKYYYTIDSVGNLYLYLTHNQSGIQIKLHKQKEEITK